MKDYKIEIFFIILIAYLITYVIIDYLKTTI